LEHFLKKNFLLGKEPKIPQIFPRGNLAIGLKEGLVPSNLNEGGILEGTCFTWGGNLTKRNPGEPLRLNHWLREGCWSICTLTPFPLWLQFLFNQFFKGPILYGKKPVSPTWGKGAFPLKFLILIPEQTPFKILGVGGNLFLFSPSFS